MVEPAAPSSTHTHHRILKSQELESSSAEERKARIQQLFNQFSQTINHKLADLEYDIKRQLEDTYEEITWELANMGEKLRGILEDADVVADDVDAAKDHVNIVKDDSKT
jgi:hypothetical protein